VSPSVIDDSTSTISELDRQADDPTGAFGEWKPVVVDEACVGVDGLKRIYRELAAMCASLDEDDDPVPTRDVLERVYYILERTSYTFDEPNRDPHSPQIEFPSGYVTSTDDGGVRIEWWKQREHCVVLTVLSDGREYIFQKLDDSDGQVHEGMTTLARDLRAFSQMTQGN